MVQSVMPMPAMRVLIIGCGYVGLPLGKALAEQGHEVFGMRRTEENKQAMKDAGITPIIADLTMPGLLPMLPGPFDWVINLVSSDNANILGFHQRDIGEALARKPAERRGRCRSGSPESGVFPRRPEALRPPPR